MNWPQQICYQTLGGFAGELPIAQAIQHAHDIGFDGIELAFGIGELLSGVTQQACSALRETAADLDLPLRTLATGAYWSQSLSDSRPEVRHASIAFTCDYLRTAQALGVATILVVPGHVAVPWDSTQPVIPYAQAWELATASLQECLPLAEELGVTIAIENVWNWFLADPIAMRTFVDQFASPYLGVYFDAGNVLINGYPEHWVEILGQRIKAVHVKNFTRTDCGGGMQGFGDDLTVGDMDWPALTAALRGIDYTGPITAEVFASPHPEQQFPYLEYASVVCAHLRQLLAE